MSTSGPRPETSDATADPRPGTSSWAAAPPTDTAEDEPGRAAEPSVPDDRGDPDADYSAEKRMGRLVAVTLAWWAHGGVRLLLAVAMLYYGFAKVWLGQFGVTGSGDALIAFGEMSPMGLLWRMVAFSPLFQVLAGVAEVGAAIALLWRRSAPLGATIAAASMSLVLVLNLGYDVPVKQGALLWLVLALIVLIPWMPRVARAFLGRGPIDPSPLPTLIPWRPVARVTNVLGPIAGLALVVLIGVVTAQMYPSRMLDESTPAGVWTVVEDTAEPAAQLSEDTRWQSFAYNEHVYGDRAPAQLRLADGTLLVGMGVRNPDGTVTLSMTPPREEGQRVADFLSITPTEIVLTFTEQADGTLHVTGEGVDLVLAPDEDGSVLFDRGFSWSIRPDDPFNR